ncbi:PREDICTED: tectonin beta-propeller repeat-containing protein [Nicrophorus vespilloides]|uniref:Tectonin beta-propeller repeat-containing protein n=1 Tax=Nicrophorus vespilloides TaxID=110193 RepID=A0ABM1NH59_NICVS|nr:PREDICTED: tectonin beta-propeller repeat-containing protein [Nicrophorus vespilloides]
MPSSLLFGINNEGRVYTLSTTGGMWRELPYVGQEFKKLSGIPHFLWALGGDHQVYVYVHGLDIPIRVREECYENERWIPIEGFSTRLLPTDRFKFSSADGTVDRTIQNIRLPSMAWQWEGDWQLDLTLNGQPLDHDGWTYAVDFPAQYYPKKQWKSCVRRRLWVRSRRYSAMNSWCAIAPLHKDATAEPFIDICIGGQSITGAEPGIMLVWAVTSHNRVMFRTGVSTRSPEGAKWTLVSVPVGCEINQLSIGSSGLVWASLLDGRALVRIGVTRDNFSGDSWVEVRGPGPNLRIMQISIGMSSVWAVTQNKQVWFRKGIKGEGSGTSEELAAGCGWVEMVGRMSLVSVTANDQVFAIGADDRAVYYRMGVSFGDQTGKRWRSLHAPLQVSRASSNASLSRDRFQNQSNSSLNRPHSLCESSGIGDWEEQSHSAPSAPTSLPVGELAGKHFETQLKNPKAWSPVRSVGSVVGTEVISDESVYNSERQDSCIFAEDEELGWAEYEAPWSWVEAGPCTIDPNQLPNWFAEVPTLQQTELDQPWRLKILEDLKSRLSNDNKYSDYQVAIDTSSWVHSGEGRICMDSTNVFIDCVLQLEWVHTAGTLTVLHPDGASTMHQFSMNEVTCVQCCSDPGSPRLSIHTPNITPPVIRLQFSSDTMLEEWQRHLSTISMQIHNCNGKANDSSVWAVTKLGEVYVWDGLQQKANKIDDNNYEQIIDLAGKEVPFTMHLHASCVPGTIITINGCVSDDVDRFAINLDAHNTYKLKHKAHAEYENCVLHINPRFNDNLIVRNSMIEGKWGEEERNGNNMFRRGQEFSLKILCKEDDFIIYIDDEQYCTYRHRLPPAAATMLSVRGGLKLFKLKMNTPSLILNPLELYWRPFGGHLRRVETCKLGVTWGIGYDHTAWVYNCGWGGACFVGLDSNNVNPMADSQDYRVYENQRWNPVTGYTSAGLPTDRYMWSDATGKQKRTRDQVKLLSMRWQWVSDWLVDFHVPGGVDRDGWQYAVDFPSTYHANKQFTDCVRRRRWYRRCAVATTGPWQELGHTKVIDVSLASVNDVSISVWGLATGGQAMIRTGVSTSTPAGVKWEHVASDQAYSSICCGSFKQVWATGRNGCAYKRLGIREDNLEGQSWLCIEPPQGAQLKHISVGAAGIWALDIHGNIYVRVENIKSEKWRSVNIDPAALTGGLHATGFKHLAAGYKEVWAVTNGGLMLRRQGICQENPTGTGWDLGIPGNWQHISIKAFE